MSFESQEVASPEEAALLALCNEEYDSVAGTLIDDMERGKSPALLSVVRPELLKGLAEGVFRAAKRADFHHQGPDHKLSHFERYTALAEHGDPGAISALPKFATSIGELVTSAEMLLDTLDTASEWRSDRKYVQFIGSFNPQHIGHRYTMRRTLEAAGDSSSGIVQVVQNHPIKKDSLPPYETRFKQGEERLYASSLLDPTTVTLLDVPLSMGLAKKGDAQIALLAHVTGDQKGRWLVGSDKFMTDVRNVRDGKALDKAGVRFSNVQLFVARRATEDIAEVREGADYVREEFGAEIILLPEIEDHQVMMASASAIRAYRAAGKHTDADRIEFGDMTSLTQSTTSLQ